MLYQAKAGALRAVQLNPFPTKPVLQVQPDLPLVSVALGWQRMHYPNLRAAVGTQAQTPRTATLTDSFHTEFTGHNLHKLPNDKHQFTDEF